MLRLVIISDRFLTDIGDQTLDITLTILACANVEEDAQVDLGIFSYTLGDPLTELTTVERQVATCEHSVFSVDLDIDPAFTIVEGTYYVTVSLESSSLAVGSYTVTIFETDQVMGFVVTSTLTVEVLPGEKVELFSGVPDIVPEVPEEPQ